jgi:hypothetical protein
VTSFEVSLDRIKGSKGSEEGRPQLMQILLARVVPTAGCSSSCAYCTAIA